MIHKLCLAMLVGLLPIAGPAMAQSVTVTGNNGGTVASDRSCSRSAGTADCSTTTTATSASGKTASKQRSRTTADGASTASVTRTGPNGQSNTRKRTVTVSP